ncbi:MAG: bifunctional DNA-formamidopyrimidine glycosylase/DNA-(apurinic or apyrimidinic site) lyase [bacterium]
MPELPEVETIKRALTRTLLNKRIERVLVRDARLRWPVDQGRLKKLAVNRNIKKITRRAKYLLLGLEQESTLIIHLGMSGRLLLLEQPVPFEKHDHVIFYFHDHTELRFRDPRRFGLVDAIPSDEIKSYPRFTHLGLEPLTRSTTPEKLFERARRLKKPIKNLLMDAHFIVGVGNIYASEALFYTGIHPSLPSCDLSQCDWERLFGEVRRVLRRAIKKGGTTLNDFVNSNGETGYFQLSLAVYGREGEMCFVCGSKIERFVQVGRSTFFCPTCQARKNAI